MTTTPPCDITNVEAIVTVINQGLAPCDERDVPELEDTLCAVIEALIPLVAAAAEKLRTCGQFGDVVRDVAVACGRRLLDSRMVGVGPPPAPESAVLTLARAARTLLHYADIR
ncbi:hypothetical protein [Streptomyces sp. NPDC002537]